jgi:hypothetical protein
MYQEEDNMEDLLTQVRAVLSTTPDRWLGLTRALTVELLSRPPAPGEWSAVDCLRHLLDTERFVFPPRVAAFLAGRDFAAFNPDSEGSRPGAVVDPAELAAEFARLRAGTLEYLTRLGPGDLSRTARHSELGLVTLGEMLHEWAGHELMHTVQGERAVMQPFIEGSGSWRVYFADHDVEIRA